MKVKRHIYISFMMIAIAVLVAHSFVPHHNHGEKNLCFEQKDCQPTEDQHATNTQTCNLDGHHLILVQSNSQLTQACNQGTSCDFHFPPILLFTGDFFDLSIDDTSNNVVRSYTNLYTSISLCATNSLRAPPQA